MPLGYQGMGYSKEYVENMTRLQQNLSNNRHTSIEIIKEPDQLCEKYPNSDDYNCQNAAIYERDATILKKLKLEIGN